MSDIAANELLARLETLEATVRTLAAAMDGRSVTAPAADTDVAQTADPARPARRDLLRYGSLAALGAAAVGLAPRSAEAANGQPIIIGQINGGSALTGLMTSNLDDAPAFGAISTSTSTTLVSAGLYGETNSSAEESVGVAGNAAATSGVVGGVGGFSESTDGVGVFGQVFRPTGFNSALWGEGSSSTGYAVFGRNTNGHGIAGITGASGGVAVIGNNSNVAGAFAGVFVGPVFVTGNFTVGGTKSAVVPHPDGSHRLVYCVESPESWFEDFGKGTLQRGQADVVIDPDFAAVVDMDDYHVFVTPYEEDPELLVSSRTACGFRIKAKDETSNAEFSWRVVARRKDVPAARLAKMDVPSAPPVPPARSMSARRWKRTTK
jgi:hypothetical protein